MKNSNLTNIAVNRTSLSGSDHTIKPFLCQENLSVKVSQSQNTNVILRLSSLNFIINPKSVIFWHLSCSIKSSLHFS